MQACMDSRYLQRFITEMANVVISGIIKVSEIVHMVSLCLKSVAKMEYNCAKCLCADCKYRGKDGCGDYGVCKECMGKITTVRYCPYYEERESNDIGRVHSIPRKRVLRAKATKQESAANT